MKDSQTNIINALKSARKPYDQQPGEPNLWYERFLKFCLYGPSRTLTQCYRDVMEEQKALRRLTMANSIAFENADNRSQEKEKPKRRGLPPVWKKRVRQFNWLERAAAWDADRLVETRKYIDEAFILLWEAAREAIQFQINLIHGKLVLMNEDGEKEVVYLGKDKIQQMRLASNSILNRAGVVYDGPGADEEDGEVKILGIRVERYEDGK